MVRNPAVSGQFYPANISELKKIIENFTPEGSTKVRTLGAILPHAGYIYSGKVAVSTVARIIPKKRLIILGPNHTGMGENYSLYASDSWHIPFGQINVDSELAAKIL